MIIYSIIGLAAIMMLITVNSSAGKDGNVSISFGNEDWAEGVHECTDIWQKHKNETEYYKCWNTNPKLSSGNNPYNETLAQELVANGTGTYEGLGEHEDGRVWVYNSSDTHMIEKMNFCHDKWAASNYSDNKVYTDCIENYEPSITDN